jgi:hypothetical protein
MVQFVNFKTTEDKIQDSLSTGITDLLNNLSSQKQRERGLEAIMPGLGQAAPLSDQLIGSALKGKSKGLETAPFSEYGKQFDKLRESGSAARQLTETARELLGDLPQARTGALAGYIPASLQSDAGQRFTRNLNKLVLLSAQSGKGLPSQMRLKLEQLAKPQMNYSKTAIENILKDIISDPESQKFIARSQALEELENQWQGNIPKNYTAILNERTNSILKDLKRESKGKKQSVESKSEQPKGSVAGQKAFAVNKKTGERMPIEWNGLEWVPSNEQ